MRSSSPLEGRVIFVVGARRSGTNWLQRILTAQPDVAAMPSETHLFWECIDQVADRFQHSTPALPRTGSIFMPREPFLDAIRAFVDAVFSENLRSSAPEARYLVERTPWHVYRLALIADVYPDASIVHIIRDGRDVARSLLSKDWGPDTMGAAAEEWRSSVEAGRAAGASLPSYVEVAYERLMAEPEASIRELYEQLGLEPSAEALRRALLEAQSQFNVDPAFPTIGSDKWRTSLSAADLRTFDRVAGPLLTELGYTREVPPRPGGRQAIAEAALLARRSGRVILRPRASVAAALERRLTRRSGARYGRNSALVQRLQESLAGGHYAVLDELLTSTSRVLVVDGAERWEDRGRDAAARLCSVLESHSERGIAPITGSFHGGPETFAIVSTYRLEDGAEWGRTLILRIEAGRVTELALYRYPIGRQPS